MKRGYFFVLLLLVSFQTFSQTYTQKWVTTTQDEYVENMTYLFSDIIFIIGRRGHFASNHQEQFTNYSNIIYKSDFNLVFSDSLVIDEIDNYDVLVEDILRVDGTGLMFWGKALEKNTHDEQLCLLWFDDYLNLIDSQILGSPGMNEVISGALQSIEGNLIFVGTDSDDLLSAEYLIWEFDSELNEIKKETLAFPVSDYPVIIEIPGTEKFHLIAGFQTYQFNSDLQYEETYEFPSNINIHPQRQNKLYNDFNYIKTAMYLSAPIPGSPWEMDLAMCLMDENANPVEVFTFGIPDSTDSPGNLDFITADTIFFGGTRNLSINPPKDSWVSLFTTNLQGEVLEHNFWGGDGQYVFSDVLALPGGGYLLAMTRWDYAQYPDTITRDIFLVTENYGNPSTGVSGSLMDKEFSLYPNPGSGMITFSGEYGDYFLELYDVHNKKVIDMAVKSGDKLNVSGLSSGVYFYRIWDEERVVSSGKWIKR